MREVVQSVLKEGEEKKGNKITRSLHHLQVQNELLHHENQGLREALTTKKKHMQKRKTPDLQQRQEYHGGAVVWSPRKLREARVRQAVKEKEEKEAQLQKAETKELKKAAQLYKQKIAEEKRVERERLKEVREKEKAEKAAKRQRQKKERDSAKAPKKSQDRKRKASRLPTASNKRQKRVASQLGHAQVQEELSSPQPQVTSRGRNVKLPKKFR